MTTPNRTRTILSIPFLAVLLCMAAPAAGQQGPPDAPHPPPEAIERLEKIRMERMQSALDLTDQEVESIRARMQEHRERMREAMEQQREAMEQLHETLRDEPVDQQEVARALEAVERERERMQALRDHHRDEVGRGLSPEKRAKMMLFNQRFEHRLRELMARRGSAAGRPMPGRPLGPRTPRRGPPPGP